MAWNLPLTWTGVVAALIVVVLLLLFSDPHRLPLPLRNIQRWLTTDLLHVFNASPFYETMKSLLEASVFAGPTYYGVVTWISTQPATRSAPISADDAAQIIGSLIVSLLGIYLCAHRLDSLDRALRP